MKGFHNSYKDRIETGQKEPPEQVWEGIRLQLNVDAAWHNVSHQLDVDHRKALLLKMAYWSAGLALVVFIAFELFTNRVPDSQLPRATETGSPDPVNNDTKVQGLVQADTFLPGKPGLPAVSNQSARNTPGVKQTNTLPVKPDPSEQAIAGKYLKEPVSATEPVPGKPPLNEAVSTLSLIKQDVNAQALPGIDSGREPLTNLLDPGHRASWERAGNIRAIEGNTAPSGADREIVLILPDQTGPGSTGILFQHAVKAKTAGKFILGMVVSAKNTWLFNNETFEGLRPGELNATRPHFALDMGIVTSYRFAPRWTVQGEFYPESKHGQSYYQYINGHYVRRDIELKYLQLDLMGKFRLSMFESRTDYSNLNLLTGLYAGRLQAVNEVIDQIVTPVTGSYRTYNYGLILGAEFEYALLRNLYISPSIRLNIGLPNIYAGDGQIPSALRKTISSSAKFSLSLGYRIPGK